MKNIDLLDSGIFLDGSNKKKRIGNSKLAELCASQFHCQWKLFNSFDELLSSLEITNSIEFSTSELLITSESVKHQTSSVQ